MMEGFAQTCGDALVALPDGHATEVDLGSAQKYAGITFRFVPGATSDFPAASILIGDKVYYSHWAPAKSHVNRLQISSTEALDAQIDAMEQALKTKATLFAGGHVGALPKEAAEFRLGYLKQMKALLGNNKTADEFVEALKKAYPRLAGEEGLPDLAKALYQ